MIEDYRLLSGDEVKELLGELLDRLARRGTEVEAYIVGGAAVAIHLGRDEVTPDVDGLFRPELEVLEEAAVMAQEHGLAPDWVNTRAVPFLQYDIAGDTEALHTTLRGRPVVVASKKALLAMKIAAYRPKDRPDLDRLIDDLDMYDPDEIVKVVVDLFGEDSVVAPNDPEELQLLAREAVHRAELARARRASREDEMASDEEGPST